MWTKHKIYFVLLIIFFFILVFTSASFAVRNIHSKTAEEELQLAEKKHGEEALMAYEHILKEYPENKKVSAEAQLGIGLVYLGHIGDKNKAEDALEKVITVFPDEKDEVMTATYWLATLSELLNLPKAKQYYQKIIDSTLPRETLHRMAERGLASTYIASQDFENAMETFYFLHKSYEVENQDNPKVELNLKLFHEDYAGLDDADKIVDAFNKFSQKYPADQNGCFVALFKTGSAYEKFLKTKKEMEQMKKEEKTYSSEEDSANRTRATADIRSNIALALDLYELNNQSYPTTEQGLKALIEKPAFEPVPTDWRGPYIKMKEFRDPWGNNYVYRYPGVHNKKQFDLFSKGKNGIGDGTDVDDITNWQQ